MSIFNSPARAALFFITSLALTTGCTHLFYHPTPGVHVPPEMVNASPHQLVIPASDGGRIIAWDFDSIDPKKEKAHILFFHGNAENLSSHYLSLLWILKHGYGFTIFDYRGFGQSQFLNSKESITPESTVADGITMLKWFKREHANKPLVVFAQSLGGAIALSSVAAANLDRPQLLVVDSGFESYQRAARDALSNHFITWPLQWLGYALVSDKAAPEKLIGSISPTPILVVHGASDPVVDIARGRKVFELAQEPKEFWEIPFGIHTDMFWRHDGFYRRQFINRLDGIFEKHLSFEETRIMYHWPFSKVEKYEVMQGYHGRFSHTGASEYALDFKMPEGAHVLAARAGKVVALRDDSSQGGNDPKFINEANFVVIDHGDETKAEYYHLKAHSVKVKVGDLITAGQEIAASGATGYVSSPHLHFMVYRTYDEREKQSIPTLFEKP